MMFYEKAAIAIAAFAFAATLATGARNWNKEEREPIRHTFTNDKTLDVDNVDGTIEVIGDNGNTIRVEGEEIVRGVDQRAVDRAKREVTLDINERDGAAQLYVNGPFRSNNGHSSDNHGFHEHYDAHEYETTFNFTIRVPRDTALELRNVNGEIKTQDTRGRFNVHGVNGGVTMTSVSGYGMLNTVNGRTSIAFRESPKQASDFKTVNGAIEASFPPNLAADLRLKTLNGQAYTDFDATALLPKASEAQDNSRGRRVYRVNHTSSVRIGAGGPELSFETVNGDIRIKKEAR
ncbi:MAG TPA: hypothetical protein VG297_02550 [Bryobacteraceae bacterium]|jgi:hypothetical protein|nr:hypothetical protein [Bryobacteraceae bacterium]